MIILKIYISGRITGLKHTDFGLRFGHTAAKLRSEGHNTFELSKTITDAKIDRKSESEILDLCYTVIDDCDAVYMLSNWHEDGRSRLEHQYALDKGKKVIYQGAQHENETSKSN